jgi:hypothetical protein
MGARAMSGGTVRLGRLWHHRAMTVVSGRGRTKDSSVALLVLTWIAVVVVPIVLLTVAWFKAFYIPDGDQPPPPAPPIVHVAMISAGAMAAAIPAFGLWFAVRIRWRRNAWAFGIVTVLALVLVLGVAGSHYEQRRHDPTPQVPVTQCIPRSGSTHGCPGG